MHISETLGLNEKVKEGGVDKFITTYGIKPDGAILNEETLKTLLGSKFTKRLDETIAEVRDGNATKEDLNEVIEDAIEIDYQSGMILFKHENNKKYPFLEEFSGLIANLSIKELKELLTHQQLMFAKSICCAN